MKEKKTRKVLEISDGSYQYICIKTSEKNQSVSTLSCMVGWNAP